MDHMTFGQAQSNFWMYRLHWHLVSPPGSPILYVAIAERRCGRNLVVVTSDDELTAWVELLLQIKEYEIFQGQD